MNQTKKNVSTKPRKKKKKASSKQKQQSVRFVLIGVVILTAVLIILGALVFSADKVISDESVSSENSELLSTVSSDEMGFPVTFSNNDIIRTESFSSKIFVLGKKILTCITDSGKIKYNHIFTFTNPEMTVSEKYGLVYDRASPKYLIFNSKGVIYEGESENGKHIIAADINNKGDVALVTKSDDSACRVSLTDKKGRVIYIWSCAEEYGVSVDLSEDGQEILCGVLGSENGTLYSKIYLLDIHSEDEAVGYKTEDSALIDVKLSGKRAIVTFNNGRSVYTFRSSGVKEDHIPYSSDGVDMIYSDKNGNTAVASKKIGSFNTNEIYVYNKNNDIIYVGHTDEEIVDVICRGKKVYLLSDTAIYESSSDGTFEAVGTKEISGEGLVICKSRLYYYSTGHVDINS
ncbi:MAG: hypothetical protein IJB74_06455 [Clostridia bacterium]|nr:hypothetical protein [Clostridia bacterium]